MWLLDMCLWSPAFLMGADVYLCGAYWGKFVNIWGISVCEEVDLLSAGIFMENDWVCIYLAVTV